MRPWGSLYLVLAATGAGTIGRALGFRSRKISVRVRRALYGPPVALYDQKSTETCDRIARSRSGTACYRPGAKNFFLAGSFAPGLFVAPGASIRLQSTFEHAKRATFKYGGIQRRGSPLFGGTPRGCRDERVCLPNPGRF